MWPLSFVLFFAFAPQPQPNSPAPGENYADQLFQISPVQGKNLRSLRSATENPTGNSAYTCFTIRSYNFRSHDGQMPVPAGVTTCTPAVDLRQRQVSRPPRVLLVPMTMQPMAAQTGEGTPQK